MAWTTDAIVGIQRCHHQHPQATTPRWFHHLHLKKPLFWTHFVKEIEIKTKIIITLIMFIPGILPTTVTITKTDTIRTVGVIIMGTTHKGLHFVTTTTARLVYNHSRHIISHRVINQRAKWYNFLAIEYILCFIIKKTVK